MPRPVSSIHSRPLRKNRLNFQWVEVRKRINIYHQVVHWHLKIILMFSSPTLQGKWYKTQFVQMKEPRLWKLQQWYKVSWLLSNKIWIWIWACLSPCHRGAPWLHMLLGHSSQDLQIMRAGTWTKADITGEEYGLRSSPVHTGLGSCLSGSRGKRTVPFTNLCSLRVRGGGLI